MSKIGMATEGTTSIQLYITELERKLGTNPGEHSEIMQQLRIWTGHLKGAQSLLKHLIER